MNVEQTKEAIEVMQAFVDGKTIQHSGNRIRCIEFIEVLDED